MSWKCLFRGHSWRFIYAPNYNPSGAIGSYKVVEDFCIRCGVVRDN